MSSSWVGLVLLALVAALTRYLSPVAAQTSGMPTFSQIFAKAKI